MTTSRQLTSLLVGSHFRPPAKLILAALPGGCQLSLVPEPENPYDASAIKVLVSTGAIPDSQYEELRTQLPSMGFDWDEILAASESVFLGYIAASGGKPLLQAGLTVGNKEFLEAMDPTDRADVMMAPSATGTLGFLPDGKATVTLQGQPS